MDIASFITSDGGFEGSRGEFDSGRASGRGQASPERSLNAFASSVPLHCSTCGGMGHQSAVCPSGAAF